MHMFSCVDKNGVLQRKIRNTTILINDKKYT